MSGKHTRKLKDSVSAEDFLSLCEKIIQSFPNKCEWNDLLNEKGDYASPFFADKLVETVNRRFLPELFKLFNKPPVFKPAKRYGVFYKDRDIYDTAYDSESLFKDGTYLTFFDENTTYGLSLIDWSSTFSFFDEYMFSVWRDDDDLKSVNLTDEKAILNHYIKDILDVDPDFMEVAFSFADSVCCAANYSDSSIAFFIQKSPFAKAFLLWDQSAPSGTDELLRRKCTQALSEIKNTYVDISYDILQGFQCETSYAWYHCHSYGFDGYIRCNIDSRYIYPQTFYWYLMADVCLNELNSRHHFYRPEEEGIDG